MDYKLTNAGDHFSSSSLSTISSVSSLSTNSSNEVDERNEPLQDEYEAIEVFLRKAQDDLSMISTGSHIQESSSPPASLTSISYSSCDNFNAATTDSSYVDFLTVSEPSDRGSINNSSSTDLHMTHYRPERPSTLSRPVLLPSCCNFKKKPWHSLVNGEYSYSKFSETDDETKSDSNLYKKELDDIMRELELFITRDRNGNTSKCKEPENGNKKNISRSPSCEFVAHRNSSCSSVASIGTCSSDRGKCAGSSNRAQSAGPRNTNNSQTNKTTKNYIRSTDESNNNNNNGNNNKDSSNNSLQSSPFISMQTSVDVNSNPQDANGNDDDDDDGSTTSSFIIQNKLGSTGTRRCVGSIANGVTIIKTRSKTLSPSNIDNFIMNSSIGDRLSVNKPAAACMPNETTPSSKMDADNKCKHPNLNIKPGRKTHHFGLKTNGCLIGRDSYSMHVKASKILMQRHLNTLNSAAINSEITTFNPVDYEIKTPPTKHSHVHSIDNGPPNSAPPSNPPVQEERCKLNSSTPLARKPKNARGSLLDKLHKTFYPSLYKKTSSVNVLSKNIQRVSSQEIEKFAQVDDKHVLSKHSSSSRNYNASRSNHREFPHRKFSLDFSTSRLYSLNEGNQSEETLEILQHLNHRKNSETTATITDQKLLQACWWLISSGFPQYVQIYREEKMPVNISQVSEDHQFLEEDELNILLKRITSLNYLAAKKLPISSPAYNKMTSVSEFQHCLSSQWTYNKLSCIWLRVPTTNPTLHISRTFTKESLSSSSSSSAASSSSSAVSASNLKSNVLESRSATVLCSEQKVPAGFSSHHNDNNSLHFTSGYASETSPASTHVFVRSSTRKHLQSSFSDVECTREYVSSPAEGGAAPEVNSCHVDFHGSGSSSNDNNAISRQFYNNMSVESDCKKMSAIIHQMNQEFCSSTDVIEQSCGYYDDEQVVPTNDVSHDAQLELDMILSKFYKDIGEVINDDDGDERCHLSNVNTNTSEHLNESHQPHQPQLPLTSSSLSPDEEVFTGGEAKTPQKANFQSRPEEDANIEFKFISASQFVVMKKLAILKLSGIFERFNLQSDLLGCLDNIHKIHGQTSQTLPADKKFFGVPPSVYLKRIGRFLPASILSLMDFVQQAAPDNVGIFRKPGVQSRILSLQKHIDLNPDQVLVGNEDVDPYDAADVFKRYLRDLPETLLTDNLCDAFSLIFSSLPSTHHVECMQCLLVLLPDVNRSILHSIFQFLHEIARHSSLNQMTPSNLSVCFLPSLFRMSDHISAATSTNATHSASTLNSQHSLYKIETKSDSRIQQTSSSSSSTGQWDHKSALSCLTFLISNPRLAFSVPKQTMDTVDNILGSLTFSYFIDRHQKHFPSEKFDSQEVVSKFFFSTMKNFNTFRGWERIKLGSQSDWSVSISSERNNSYVPSWKCHVELLAPPVEVLSKIHRDAQPWAGNLVEHKVAKRMMVEHENIHREVVSYQFFLHSKSERKACEIRAWKTDLPKESCFYCSKSMDPDQIGRIFDGENSHDVPMVDMLESSFFLEPCGEGLTSLTHISTVDLQGHSADWYEMAFPTILLNYFRNLQQFFKQKIVNTGGPETKV